MKYELCAIVGNQDKIKEKLKINKLIGTGGESSVFSVEDKKSGDKYALVFNHTLVQRKPPLDSHEKFVQLMVLNQDINPHQAKILGHFWMTSRNLGIDQTTNKKKLVHVWDNLKDGDITNRHYENDISAQTFRHQMYLLELGICDLASKKYDNLIETGMCNREIDNLQSRINDLSLDTANIISSDNQDRNHILTKASDCSYNGKKMSDYDFWAYHLHEELTLYVPRQEYIVKRIDYINWKVTDEKRKFDIDSIKRFFDRIDYEEYTQKPSSGSILDICPNKHYQKKVFTEKDSLQEQAAVKIQSLIRGHQVRTALYAYTNKPDFNSLVSKGEFTKAIEEVKKVENAVKKLGLA